MKALIAAFVAGISLFPAVALGQSQAFSIPTSAIAGGGGASSGGAFTLNSTIGQPDATVATGGSFTLRGGFLPITVESLPLLSIRIAGSSSVILSWRNPSSGFVLQQTTDMGSSGTVWTDATQTPVVSGPNKEVTVPAAGQFRMFRLHRP